MDEYDLLVDVMAEAQMLSSYDVISSKTLIGSLIKDISRSGPSFRVIVDPCPGQVVA